MSQELIYTSAPRGLKPGSQGFCTVAHTAQMPAALVDRIESLSGYTPVFPPSSPRAAENPVSYCHWKLDVLGQNEIVVSRVAAAGLDYTDRTNKLAHHIVLSRSERPAGGPAWLVRQRDLLRSTWDGEVGTIAAGPAIPKGDREPAICEAWNRVTGDAGWAGALVESFLTNPERLVYVIYPHGLDVLELFEEAIALVPVSRRWEITFCTYLTTVPQGVRCQWRGVLQGTAPEQQARNNPHAFKIDLTNGKLSAAPDSAYADFARTGISPQTPIDQSSDPADWREENLERTPPPAAVRQVPANLQAFALAPVELASSSPSQFIPPNFAPNDPAAKGQGRRRRALWPFLLGFVVVALMSFGIGVTLSRIGLFALSEPKSDAADEKPIAENPPRPIEVSSTPAPKESAEPKAATRSDAVDEQSEKPAKDLSPQTDKRASETAKPSGQPIKLKQETAKNETPAKEPTPTPAKEEEAGDDKKPVEEKEKAGESKTAEVPKAESKPPVSPTSDDSKLKVVPDERIVYIDLSPPEVKPSGLPKSAESRSGQPLMSVPASFKLEHLEPAIDGTGLRLTRIESGLLVTIPYVSGASGLTSRHPIGRPIATIQQHGDELSLSLKEESADAGRKALAATPLRVRMDNYDFIVFRGRTPKAIIPLDRSNEVQLAVFGPPNQAKIVFTEFAGYSKERKQIVGGKMNPTSPVAFEYRASPPSDYQMTVGIVSENENSVKLSSIVTESSVVRPLTSQIVAIKRRMRDILKVLKELNSPTKQLSPEAKEERDKYISQVKDPYEKAKATRSSAGLIEKLEGERTREQIKLDRLEKERARHIDYHEYEIIGMVCQIVDGQLIPILEVGDAFQKGRSKDPSEEVTEKNTSPAKESK